MKNKYLIISLISISSIFFVLFGLVNYLNFREYENNYNYVIASIMERVTDAYPDITKDELMSIINQDVIKDKNILIDYGIDLDKDRVGVVNKNIVKKIYWFNGILILGYLVIVVIFILLYAIKRNKEIKKITKYVEEINRKNYKLEILSNDESSLSILQNEIYKTMVMLRESADNSLNDKLKLKESLSDISHQLKTPLTSISIMLDNILDNPDMEDDLRIEFINDIRRDVHSINFLVQTLLKLSKFDVNAVSFASEDIIINDVINEALKNVSVLSDLKNIKFNLIGDVNSKIKSDYHWQVEAITNIIKNGIEHSRDGSNIDINVNATKLYLEVSIRDYGVGISSKDLPHIFKRFYKVKGSSSDSVGIGLSLAKSIFEASNASLRVESQVNKGTVFIIKYYYN